MYPNTRINSIIRDFLPNDNVTVPLFLFNVTLVSEMEIVLDKYAIMCDTA